MFFFFNDTATTEIYTLSLHDALPISLVGKPGARADDADGGGPGALPELLRRRLGLGATSTSNCWRAGRCCSTSRRKDRPRRTSHSSPQTDPGAYHPPGARLRRSARGAYRAWGGVLCLAARAGLRCFADR